MINEAEGRAIWKLMHMQPIYRMNGFVIGEGNRWAKTNDYIAGGDRLAGWETAECGNGYLP